MKLMIFFLFVASMAASARSGAQTITLHERGASLERIFSEIRRQSGYEFIAPMQLIASAPRVNVSVKNASITEALDACFRGLPLTYEIDGKTIVVRKKAATDTGPLSPNAEAAPPPIDVRGRIIDDKGEPVAGASILVKGTGRGTTTNDNGEFELKGVDDNATLVISGVSIESFEVKVNGRIELALGAKMKTVLGEEVKVFSTGYQNIPKERATGSFYQINLELLNRRVSTNVLDRIDGITSGVIFNKYSNRIGNDPSISIRGRSTIFANTEPLIVLDNFPYYGDINNINPNDVENITVLKDAAAASIWGATSGNGVIVITTKKGKYKQGPTVSLNSNVTVAEKPDLFYSPQLSSGEYSDLETFLFNQGFYNSRINNKYSALSPVVEVLLSKRNGTITDVDATNQINKLTSHDLRNDLERYFYRNAVTHRQSLSLNGGGATNKYFLSVGYDKNFPSLTYNDAQRFTINANNTNLFFKEKLEMNIGILITESNSNTGNSGGVGGAYPYSRLADDNGKSLSIPFNYRQTFVDTVGGGLLLDWNYRPLDEIRNAALSTRTNDYKINASLRYRIFDGFDASIIYQHGRGAITTRNYNSESTYYTRNLINSYSQINRQSGSVTRPIPIGGIVTNYNTNYLTNYLRGQVSYSRSFGKHQLNIIGGSEIRGNNSSYLINQLYGYNNENATSVIVDYLSQFPIYPTGGSSRIPNPSFQQELVDRFLSYYSNGSYGYLNRYILSGSVRKDESNLFGVKSNQKGVPLWSAGFLWVISREKFFWVNWVNSLKLRTTYGYNGNVDRTVSAFTTAQLATQLNQFSQQFATIQNPPNPSLRWEKIRLTNFAVDFEILNSRISGSVEYYIKNGMDLIGFAPNAPQTGLVQFKGNSADIRGNGFDVSFSTVNIDKALKWKTNFLFSFTKDIVSNYKVNQPSNSLVVQANYKNPVQGKPYSSLFSYKWGGLDSLGNPQGYLNKTLSTNYTAIANSIDRSELVYNGRATPSYFGSLRNTFSWKEFEFSFNLTYKFGYYFRRPALQYSDLFNGNFRQPDFGNRWKNRGDEKITNVPSLTYPANSSRDLFYALSEILVEKADHIRLQDIQFSYNNRRPKGRVFKGFSVYVYANNLGILWKATKYQIDPDFVIGIPDPKNLSIGFKSDF